MVVNKTASIDNNSIENFFHSYIAQQCPYEGGIAVYTARSLLRIINDSIEYYDDIVCLQAGYYRFYSHQNETKPEIRVIPNPASDIVDIYTLI